MGNMKNIVFKEQEGVFVADFASEGNCVIYYSAPSNKLFILACRSALSSF